MAIRHFALVITSFLLIPSCGWASSPSQERQDSHRLKALKLYSKKNFSSAVSELKKALANAKTNSVDSAIIATDLGNAFMAAGSMDDAVRYLKTEAINKRNPDRAFARQKLTQALRKMGKDAEAAKMEDEQAQEINSIGVTWMEPDGTIVMQLTGTMPGGMRGDALLRYGPTHARYAQILEHIGTIQPGERKDVRPFEDD